MSGKGDAPRPKTVDADEWARRWAATFGTPDRRPEPLDAPKKDVIVQ